MQWLLQNVTARAVTTTTTNTSPHRNNNIHKGHAPRTPSSTTIPPLSLGQLGVGSSSDLDELRASLSDVALGASLGPPALGPSDRTPTPVSTGKSSLSSSSSSTSPITHPPPLPPTPLLEPST